MAVDQELVFINIKLLFIITGFAEVQSEHPALGSCVLAALDKVAKNVSYPKIVLASPVPQVSASVRDLKSLFGLSKQLQGYCKHSRRFEFTKTGLLVYGPGGVYANLLDANGITKQGFSILRIQIVDKLHSVGFKRVY